MDDLNDVMQPQPNRDTVSLPITFDYNGGRSESSRTRKVLAWMFGVIFFLIGLGILFRGTQGFFLSSNCRYFIHCSFLLYTIYLITGE